jgi:hypothetical protein
VRREWKVKTASYARSCSGNGSMSQSPIICTCPAIGPLVPNVSFLVFVVSARQLEIQSSSRPFGLGGAGRGLN